MVSSEVRRIKNEFHKKYNHHEAVKSVAVIKLADFRMNEEGEENLIHSLDAVNRHQPPVKVTLKNFGHAGTHTIYIDVIKPMAIVTLVKVLKKKLQLPGSQSFFAFKQYLPVAKNLTEEKFKMAFADFQQREFSASFIACSMSLLKRKSKQDNYLLIKEFEYADAGTFATA
ncbi:MAG TPA: 2'-5' RNA ligase family protein [Bacteroidia bacterium]|nr:2'-5' RNA ligase family protein [Bacteroidia bacterium]